MSFGSPLRSLFLAALPFYLGAQTISFLSPTNLAAGGAHVVASCPHCVAVADFNGDGNPDLAINILQPLPQTRVLLGHGNGAFQPAPGGFVAEGSLRTGDFNGDGKVDLLSGDDYNTQLRFGKGDGTFGDPIPVSACASLSSVQLADFNRDDKTDLLCGTSLFLSVGDGTFQPARSVITQPLESVVLAADFNGDGIPDLLLRRLSGILAVAPGKGDGGFGGELTLIYQEPPESNGNPFLTGDFNGDGKLDLIAKSIHGNRIDFLPGVGDGTFGALIQTDVASYQSPDPMTALGDFNNDGKLDFVAGDAIYAGNGDGTFRFPVFFGPTTQACGAAFAPPSFDYSCDYDHGSTAVGDFNRDGLPDLAVYVVTHFHVGQIQDDGQINVLLNDSPGNGFYASGLSAVTGTWPVGANSIVSAYGVNLAPTATAADTNPAPTTLGGIRLHIRDRSTTGDRLAPLLYVSPTQINYLLPSSDTFAWVDIERVGQPYVPQGMTVPIVPLAPGIFPLAWTASAPGYLSLYGTGFAQAAAAFTSCTVGDANVRPSYAGPEIQIAGLDQVNLFLPQSLAAAGAQPVTCLFETLGGIVSSSNTVTVTIR